MTNSMKINRKLVMTSAKGNKSNYHITKIWSLMSAFYHRSKEELKTERFGGGK